MGFFDKLKKITTNLFSTFTEADEAFFEELEETLILADLGVETFGVHGVDMKGYEDLLVETLKCRPHLIVDDGGDLIMHPQPV